MIESPGHLSGGSLDPFSLIDEGEGSGEGAEEAQKPTGYVYLPLMFKNGSSSAPIATPPSPIANSPSSTATLTLYLPLILNEGSSLFAAGLAGPAITRTFVYTYDKLYHLTHATYSTGESYQYSYDPVGNRLQMGVNY